MRWIYLSPHLDDAALSAGGLIYEQTRAGAQVEIWSFMCGFPRGAISPVAEMMHAQWGFPQPEELIRARRAEDIEAANILGARAIHFDFLDCIYRRGKNGDWLYADVFVQPHEDESALPNQIAEFIAARILPDDQIVCQFGIGSHVDHILVRRAAELLRRPLLYLTDIPYHFRAPQELALHTAQLERITHPISEAGVEIWQESVEKYNSQLSGLFESLEEMREKIRQYWAENNGICLWNSG